MRRGRTYAAAVFDLDGTLIELPVDWTAVRRDLAKDLGDSLSGVSIFDAINERTAPGSDARASLFSVIDSHEVPAAEEALPIDGARELLESVSKNLGVALVTMQGRPACTRVLDRLGLARHFKAVFTRENSLDRSEQLVKAYAALGASPSDSLFVGDKLNDLRAGRKLGASVALVGKRAKEEWQPEFLFRELSELRSQLFSS